MKKILLLAAGFAITAGLWAQQPANVTSFSGPVKAEGLSVKKFNPDAEFTVNSELLEMLDAKRAGFKATGNRSIQRIPMGSSHNPYTLLVSESQCLTANEDVNVIMFTHRQCNTYAGGSGRIQSSFSTDGGSTFDSSLVIFTGAELGRYPSGAISNPAGNTTWSNAYSVISGPYTDGAGWKGNFYASSKLNGQNNNQFTLTNSTDAETHMARYFMHSTKNGNVFVLGERNTDNGQYYTSYKTVINKAVFNSGTNAFDWSEIEVVPAYTVGSNGTPDGYRSPGMASTDDGTASYLVYMGRDATASDPLSFMPMLYKSTDQGGTWTKQAAFDWTGIEAITDNINAGAMRPAFGLVKDVIVDGNGYVHIACFINTAYSNHPDSLGYYLGYANIKGFAYDVFQTANGWDAVIIDTVWTVDVDDANSPWSELGWGERLQMSKSPDGTKIFYAWMDTNPELGLEYNLAPDVLVRGMDINTGIMTATKNVTTGTLYESDNFFMYFSDRAFKVGNEYKLHVSVSQLGATNLAPAIHYYLNGVTFHENDFLSSVENITSPVADFNIYPNPNNGSFSINFTMKNTENGSLKVMNTLGSVVYQENISGSMTKSYDFNHLPTGMYFVELESAAGRTVKKMIRN